MNKTLILIDGRSAHAMSRALEKSIDFKKLVDHIKTLYSLDAEDIVASVYLNNTVDGENTAARKLYDWLGNNGFVCQILDFSTETNKNVIFPKICEYLSIAARSNLDRVVLLAHDNRFVDLLVKLQVSGVKATLVGTRKPEYPKVSSSLRFSVSDFIELDDIDISLDS